MTGYKGKFIVLEGIDGSGTTTQTSLVTRYLFEQDKRNVVLQTREPTKISIYGIELRARLVRAIQDEHSDDASYMANLFVQDRQWHLDNFVVPTLNAGGSVISDRHKLSTIAYQTSQGGDMDELIAKHDGMRIPDLTLLLDINANTAFKRMQNARSTESPELFDATEFSRVVQANYLEAARRVGQTEQIVIVDGSKSIDDVAKEIQHHLNKLFGYEKSSN